MMNSRGNLAKFLLHSAENISGIVFGLIGAAMVARVFGPENLGRLSVVQSLSAILMALATLGLDHFILRDLAKNKDDAELKGSVLLAQSVGWLFYFLSLAGFFFYRGELAKEIFIILSVAVSTYFLRVLYLKLYFQATNDAGKLAISTVVSRLGALGYLFIASAYKLSYDLMVLYLPIQAILQALFLFVFYRRNQTSADPARVSATRTFTLLKESAPVIASTILYFGYSQADVLIMSHFMSMRDVGIYSAGTRLIPQAIFLGHVTVITFYGAINEKYGVSQTEFFDCAVRLARLQFAMAIGLGITVSLLSPVIVWLLYGSKFDGSEQILAIGVWAWVFMLPACLFSRLLVLAKLAKYELLKMLVVAPVSLGLNFLLIPRFGSSAAALVLVLTYLLTDFLVYALFKETRFIFHIAVEALRSLFFSPRFFLNDTRALFAGKV